MINTLGNIFAEESAVANTKSLVAKSSKLIFSITTNKVTILRANTTFLGSTSSNNIPVIYPISYS